MYTLRSNLIGFQASVRLVKRIDRSVSLGLLAIFSLLTLLSFFPIQFMTLADNLAGAMVAYTDVLPGQPRSAAAAHGFVCSSQTVSGPAQNFCTLYPEKGPFFEIYLHISSIDQSIQQISFIMRGNSFRVGDLELLSGLNYRTSHSHVIYYSWRNYFLAVMTDMVDNHRTYFHLISNITISETTSAKSGIGFLP